MHFSTDRVRAPTHNLRSIVVLLMLATTGTAQESQTGAPKTSPAEPRPIVESVAPPYTPVELVAGKLRIVGSGTMSELAALWARSFSKIHPKVECHVDCRTTETAVPLLQKGEPAIALMSRPLTADELKDIEKQTGSRPVVVAVGQDVLAVIVHIENPIEVLSRAQFRRLLAEGEKTEVTWGDLGLKVDWAKKPVAVHGRQADSITRRLVVGWALGATDRERKVNEHVSHDEVVAAVAADKAAIGYATRHATEKKVKVLALQDDADDPLSLPTDEEVWTGRYPLVRELYLVVGKAPKKNGTDLRS